MIRRVLFGCAGLPVLVMLVACSDGGGGSNRGIGGAGGRSSGATDGGTPTVCGITCDGSVSCSGGITGSASAKSGACVISWSQSTATLTCDGKVTATDLSGSTTGTWMGGGTSVKLNIGDQAYNCTIVPT